MSTTSFHLAQFNIGRIVAPVDDPQLADFMAGLDEINKLAEASPGFVWRYQTDEGNATATRPYDDDQILINMSVWESLEALREFVYRSTHSQFLARRKEWFSKFDGPYTALWWVPAGHIPSIDEAKGRLEQLRVQGETAEAFSFRAAYPAPDFARR